MKKYLALTLHKLKRWSGWGSEIDLRWFHCCTGQCHGRKCTLTAAKIVQITWCSPRVTWGPTAPKPSDPVKVHISSICESGTSRILGAKIRRYFQKHSTRPWCKHILHTSIPSTSGNRCTVCPECMSHKSTAKQAVHLDHCWPEGGHLPLGPGVNSATNRAHWRSSMWHTDHGALSTCRGALTDPGAFTAQPPSLSAQQIPSAARTGSQCPIYVSSS